VTDLEQAAPSEANSSEAEPRGEARGSWLRRHVAVLVPWTLVVALAAALTVVLVSSSADDAGASAAGTYDVGITFVLYDLETFRNGCVGDGGYSDIGPGAQITVRNGSGDILGVGSLGSGTPTSGAPKARCTYRATVDAVPAGEGFYSVEIASRGEITQPEAELKANGHEFQLSLGL
jgi:hypothetical protein